MINHHLDTYGDLDIIEVKLADADNAVYLREGEDIAPKGVGRRVTVGNVFWRSPEAQVGVGINKASDVFSFGIIVSPRVQNPILRRPRLVLI
jgi:hypothetical protein